MDKMTDSRAVEVLAAHNAWRRGGDGPATDPTTLGLALDHAIARLREPAVVPALIVDHIGNTHSWPLMNLPSGTRLFTTPQPPAEAQAQGGGEVVAWGDVDEVLAKAHKLSREINNDELGDHYLNLSADLMTLIETARSPRRGLARTAPPSAPVEVEDKARAMFEAQADELAAPWDRQWEPTKDFWRKRAAEALAQQPATTATKDAEIEALRAEVDRWKIAGREWLDKTEWVQQTIKPRELGRHRADILRERIQRSEARAERLAEALREMLLNAPGGHSCEEFHHHKSDRHMPGDDCPAQLRWVKAVSTAQAALLRDQEEGHEQ